MSEVELLPPVQAFKNFIENDPTVYTEFQRMFDMIPAGEHPSNYIELINDFNEIFRQAPDFGSLGPPMYMIMANIMNSQGGFSAYTKDNLNMQFKDMMVTWTRYLMSSDSRSVLNDSPTGWLSPNALKAMTKDFNPNRTFDQIFVSDPKADYYGYTSFEDFFNRRFKEPQTDRPTGPLDDLRLISAACESTTYAYQENVKKMDPLFIKDEAYSLHHLLAGNYVDEFEGGIVLQGFLNTTSYHRWHAPCNGTIMKIVSVPGTYFAQGPYTIGLPTGSNDMKATAAPPFLQSLRYFANTATRLLIFINADNTKLGMMCFIAIGMTEISTCEATVFEGQQVKRGEELGMFHFGGSSSALVFRKDANVVVAPEYRVPEASLKINEPIATCDV
jgi:phosphatidylserine decarboxylase